MPLFNSDLDHSQRRACILDLPLALSSMGVTLARSLSPVMELWVVRELWHILNNPNFYLERPELLAPIHVEVGEPHPDRAIVSEITQALQTWQTFRREHDLTGLRLFWLGDSLQESLLPRTQHSPVFQRWEAIAASLDHQLDNSREHPSNRPLKNSQSLQNSLFPLAIRDAIALTVCLESAFVLTRQPLIETEENATPDLCQLLETWGIPCQELSIEHPSVAMERTFLQQLFIQMGLAHLLWQHPKLIAFYISAPKFQAAIGSANVPQSLVPRSSSGTALENPALHQPRVWSQARGFWFSL
ncbi:hypothetical protein [Leptolyngbya ohadii]|uniref:hypothetical protein n=1 Tax=Leptolyngbya ohadii TaxID=1962290 RepID=UPI000B5A201E|nr:hypothetical protein [Leptolyngbya ohadii]